MKMRPRRNDPSDSPSRPGPPGRGQKCHVISDTFRKGPAPGSPGAVAVGRGRGGLALLAVAAVVFGLLIPQTARAMDATAWKHRQPLVVERAGILKIALPPETLGLARPGLEDLRLLNPAGREVPFVFTLPPPAVAATTRVPLSFRATLTGPATELLLATGSTEPIEAVMLETPAPGFLKGARVEILAEGGRWETLADNVAIFRQFGAQQLRLELGGRMAAYVRVTIDDRRSRPVPFSGARLALVGSAAPEVTTPIAVRIVRREEFAGESVLALDLGGAHVPLASLEFRSAEPLFARAVTFTARELRDDAAVERTLGSGSIWRVAGDGGPASARLDVPVRFTAPSRELLVHVANGDSPPLAVEGITARQRPHWLVFHAAESGTYAVLVGNAQVEAPRYDLASLATELRDTPPSPLVPGPAEPNPGYRAADGLAGTVARGAALDPVLWGFRKPVQLESAGVQQLELDLEVLGRAQAGLADLRLVRDGAQVPYLLERPALARSRELGVTSADDPKRPRVSRWRLKLPRARLPITRLTLASPTALFQRHLRLFEEVTDERRGHPIERTLAEADWSHTPGEARPLTLICGAVPQGDGLLLETDNGDNPPIELAAVQAAFPVARLLFQMEATAADPAGAGGLALYYGNPAALVPRYDLALVAGQILAAEKWVALLGAEEPTPAGGWTARFFGSIGSGAVFWGALVLVVIGLFAIIARLLPKPPKPAA